LKPEFNDLKDIKKAAFISGFFLNPMVVVPNGQANTEIIMTLLNFLLKHQHEYLKNVLLSMKVDSLFEI
jgi:hypothetical protein